MLHDKRVQPTFCSSSVCSAKIEDFMELYLYSPVHLSDSAVLCTGTALPLYLQNTYVSKRLCLIQVVCHRADVSSMPTWSTWDSLWPKVSCLSPKFFSFIIYQCSILELLIYNLSIWQHHKIKTNLTLKPIRFSGYFNGYVLVYEPRHSQIRLCCFYAAHHIDAVCLKLFSLFGYVCSWEIFLQMGRVIIFWDVMPCNL